MKAIIIEDEEPAVQALGLLVGKLYPEIEVVATMQSAEESIEWLTANSMPDLIFMDIRLSDDLSFSIFDHVRITASVIFITAYDEYALKAFEVNSIDYLLKPINEAQLVRAVEKYKNLTHRPNRNYESLLSLLTELRLDQVKYKSHFLISHKDRLIPLAVKDIAYVYIDAKAVYILTFDKRKWYIEQTLDEIMKQLDPHEFYRVNRQYIVSRQAINNINIWFGGKLSINLTIPPPERICISKARVKDFKDWLTGC